MSYDVLTVGEAMASFRSTSMLRLGGAVTLSVAGAESNVAIGLARLGHRACWAGRVGDDELGALVLRTLRAERVDVSHALVTPGRTTGVVLFDRGPGGAVRAHYRRSTSAARELRTADLKPVLAEGARIVHVTGITTVLGAGPAEAVEHLVRESRQAGTAVSLDVNHRSKLASAADTAARLHVLLPYVDVLVASEEELAIVADARTEQDRVAQLLDRGVREVVVKRGDRGGSVTSTSGSVSAPALAVPVADPVGAGDAFTAGYLSGMLDGLPVEERLSRAITLGAAAVAAAGDWEGLPTRAELALFGGGDVVR